MPLCILSLPYTKLRSVMARLCILLWIYSKAQKQLYLISCSIFSISFTRGSSYVLDPVAAWSLKIFPISVIRRFNHSVRRTIILSIRSINLSSWVDLLASTTSDFSLCWPSNHSTYQLSKSSSFIGTALSSLIASYPPILPPVYICRQHLMKSAAN